MIWRLNDVVFWFHQQTCDIDSRLSMNRGSRQINTHLKGQPFRQFNVVKCQKRDSQATWLQGGQVKNSVDTSVIMHAPLHTNTRWQHQWHGINKWISNSSTLNMDADSAVIRSVMPAYVFEDIRRRLTSSNPISHWLGRHLGHRHQWQLQGIQGDCHATSLMVSRNDHNDVAKVSSQLHDGVISLKNCKVHKKGHCCGCRCQCYLIQETWRTASALPCYMKRLCWRQALRGLWMTGPSMDHH